MWCSRQVLKRVVKPLSREGLGYHRYGVQHSLDRSITHFTSSKILIGCNNSIGSRIHHVESDTSLQRKISWAFSSTSTAGKRGESSPSLKIEPSVKQNAKLLDETIFNEIKRLEKATETFLSLVKKKYPSNKKLTYKQNRELYSLLYEWRNVYQWKKQQKQASMHSYPRERSGDWDEKDLLTRAAYSLDQLIHMMFDQEELNLNRNKATSKKSKALKKYNKAWYCHLAITAWARSAAQESVTKAFKILERMETISTLIKDTDYNVHLAPDAYTYNAVLTTVQKTMPDHSDELAISIFQKMKNSPDPAVHPMSWTYNILLDILTKHHATANKQQQQHDIESYLQELETLSQTTEDVRYKPDAMSYGVVIKFHVNSGNIQKAEDVVHRMEDLYKKTNDKAYRPNFICYANIIAGYAQQQKFGNAQNAERVLRSMLESYRNGNDSVKPNWITFNHVIYAYAKTKNGAYKAESILQYMEQEYLSGNENVKPNVRSFGIVLDAFAREGKGDKALQILYKMNKFSGVSPNLIVYNTVINAIAKSREKDAGTKAENLLREMHHLYKTAQNLTVNPDIKTYTGVMEAYVKSIGPNVNIAGKIESLIQEIEDIYREEKRIDMEPDVFIYSILVNAIVRQQRYNPGIGDKVLQVLKKVEDAYDAGNEKLKPTEHIYNSVVHAFTKNIEEGFTKRSYELIKHMEERCRRIPNAVKPDYVTYVILLQGLTKSASLKHFKQRETLGEGGEGLEGCANEDMVQQAESILESILMRFQDGDDNFRPNILCFNNVIAVIARSIISEKAERAWNVFQKMKTLAEETPIPDLEPNITTFNWILHACSREEIDDNAMATERSQKALQIALQAFDQIKTSKSFKANSATYHLLLIISRRLIADDEERRKAIQDIFVQCCHDGLVNRSIVNELYRAMPEISFGSVMGDNLDENNIPNDWTRNA